VVWAKAVAAQVERNGQILDEFESRVNGISWQFECGELMKDNSRTGDLSNKEGRDFISWNGKSMFGEGKLEREIRNKFWSCEFELSLEHQVELSTSLKIQDDNINLEIISM
jgi:hypothetical protein